MANIVELRDMSDEKLEEMLENAREEMFNLRFQHASARLSDMSRIRKVRREIAQLETTLHLRDLAIAEAAKQPQVAEAIEGETWNAEAHFSYEDSAWQVAFFDENDDDLVTTLVDLNKKKSKGRRSRKVSVGK